MAWKNDSADSSAREQLTVGDSLFGLMHSGGIQDRAEQGASRARYARGSTVPCVCCGCGIQAMNSTDFDYMLFCEDCRERGREDIDYAELGGGD